MTALPKAKHGPATKMPRPQVSSVAAMPSKPPNNQTRNRFGLFPCRHLIRGGEGIEYGNPPVEDQVLDLREYQGEDDPGNDQQDEPRRDGQSEEEGRAKNGRTCGPT